MTLMDKYLDVFEWHFGCCCVYFEVYNIYGTCGTSDYKHKT